MWVPDHMMKYSDSLKVRTIDEYIRNACVVINDFMELVTEYGEECDGKQARHDRRFKVYVNGSYYELADYVFVYRYMYDENRNLVKYWECITFEGMVKVNEKVITRGELAVMRKLGEI